MTDTKSTDLKNPELYTKYYPEGVKWDSKLETSPLHKILEHTAQKFPGQDAFNFLGKTFSWKKLNDEAVYLAGALQKMGVGKGSKIGICLPNCPFYISAYFGIARTGATIVNYNPLYADEEIRSQIEDSETDMLITADLSLVYDKIEKRFRDTNLKNIIVCKFPDALPFPKNILFKLFKSGDLAKVNKNDNRVLWFHDLVAKQTKPEEVDINTEEDAALFQYTGGTTGSPKGVMLTHANITANISQADAWLSGVESGQEKMLGVIPFFHVFAMTAVMNLSVYKGFEIFATPRFELEDTLKLINKHKPTIFPAVPAIYSAINNRDDLDKYDLSSLKYCISGGAPLPVEVKKQFENKTGCYLVEGYGLTESSPIVCVNPPGGKNPEGSIGLPLPGTLVKITDKEDPEKELGLDEAGELCVKGPQVMKGYWGQEEATRDTLVDGWLHTGDVAKVDEDGFVYIVDRLKDMIITNGYNVYPRHVEEAIYQHPDVEECIVAGVPDSHAGEIVKAWIKLKKDKKMSVSELKSFLEDKISKIKQPRKIEFRDDPLPKTMIGKLSRKDILEEEKHKNQDGKQNIRNTE